MRTKIWNTFSLSAQLQKLFGLIPLPDFLNCLKVEWVDELDITKRQPTTIKGGSKQFHSICSNYCDTIWMTKNCLIRQNDNELLYLWVLFMDSLTVFINFFSLFIIFSYIYYFYQDKLIN